MTHLNNQVISCPEKKAIAETVHETLCEFRDELKGLEDSGYAGYTDNLEGSCFYYAALGVEVCKKFYQQRFNDTESDYTLKAGFFALRPYKDKTQQLAWLRYSGDIDNNINDYHCWIVGPVSIKDGKEKFDIIDFTARHYKAQVEKKAKLSWEREDLEKRNFIWNDNHVLCDYHLGDGQESKALAFAEEGLVFGVKEDTTIKIKDEKWTDWKSCDLRVQMMEKSAEILSYKLANLENQA
ncbi:hypothetical protein FJR11_02765 [Anabaena sp. UHCC 0187]|uniref:hypothetical protein n=1 Tax=Anabaena sp. UHCC 0187 TaxID=2590018 RepID=UPI001445EC4C|nr:hypothetical protein [Anabaena sp. UHCC 0187]MTJ11536.1 hypothetical protein [Anabaena sp. UHCC 0187]